MKLSQIINQSTDHLDFWDKLETEGGRLLFEEYVAFYLKATLTGQTYWLGEEVVPPHIAEIHNFSKILKGARSIGADIINVNANEVVAYESKWFDFKETIRFAPVANKLQVIRKTGIDRLIFATNARKASDQVLEFAEEAGFMFQSDWITAEVFQTVKDYINNQKKKIYSPMRPRDDFFQNSLDELNVDFTTKFLNTPLSKILTRIFQHWPAASGKGSFPRLAYDMIFEPRWNYKKAYPINTIVNPTLVVLKGNLIKQIQHDQGLGNQAVVHVIYAGDVTKSANTEELQSIRAMAKVFTKKIEFVKFLRETKNKTIWIHTTVHSYDALARTMRAQNKKFFFGHIDEVHHMIQPDYSTWTAPLNDQACEIQIRLMTSANRRKARGTGCSYSMDAGNFCDLMVKDLDEKTAVALGYKRKTILLNYLYNEDSFPIDYIERFENNNQPLVKLRGTNIVVPVSWFMAADSLIRFRVENTERNHTKLTLNTIKECQKFAEFFDVIRKNILKTIPGLKSQDAVYRRLLKAKIMVADTANNSTVKLLKEVNAVPSMFEDSFIIHCRLLGEGWDPENGWIDSNMFVSPTWSDIRIYQDVNRGSRIGDGSKSINYVVQFFLNNDESHFNDMFNQIKNVGEALEIGVDEITEQVFFKDVRSIPKGQKTNRQVGQNQTTYYDELTAEFAANAFGTYIREGRYHKFGQVVNEILIDWIKMDQEREGWKPGYNILKEMKKDIKQQYKDYFNKFKASDNQANLQRIINGEHFLLSDENVEYAINWQIKREELNNSLREKIKNIIFNQFASQIDKIPKINSYNKIGKSIFNIYDSTCLKIAKFEIKKLNEDTNHWQNQQKKIYNILVETSKNQKNMDDWLNDAFDKISKNNISVYGISPGWVRSSFLNESGKYIKILSKDEKDVILNIKYEILKNQRTISTLKRDSNKNYIKSRETGILKRKNNKQWLKNISQSNKNRRRPFISNDGAFSCLTEGTDFYKITPASLRERIQKHPDQYKYITQEEYIMLTGIDPTI
jgi:hypothetical protein